MLSLLLGGKLIEEDFLSTNNTYFTNY